MKQQSKQWFEARKGRVTDSVVGAILGIAPYMTREEALRSMVRSYHGAEREFIGNIATEWGNTNEETARWEYELETGNTVKEAGFDRYEDWLGASPDGYVGDDGLLEIKCPFGIRKDEPPVFKSIEDQPHYYAQIQIQLHVTGREWCHFWQWTQHGTKLETVNYDQAWIDENLPKLRQFYAEYLSELDNPEHLEPLRKEINTEETRRLVDEYDQLSEAIDNATERKKEVLAELVKASGEKNALVWGKKLTLTERVGSVSYAKVVKDHCPDVDLEQYRGKPSKFWGLK